MLSPIMKRNVVCCGCLLACLAMAAMPAGAQEEGFVFTEEEVAADAQREFAALISDGVQYEAACHAAYMEISTTIAGCCNRIPGTADYTECTNDPDADALHHEAISTLLGRHPYSASAGQFTDGVLSRATLAKAKSHLTEDQCRRVEHMILRAELLMRWFIGPFRMACAQHHYDFQKEVQRVARFLEYVKTPDFEGADKAYAELSAYLSGDTVSNRIFTAMNSFDYNSRQAYVFYQYFHNRISDNERDIWACYMLMGSSLRHVYDGPILGLGKEEKLGNGVPVRLYLDVRGLTPVYAASEPASKLSCYMRNFERWSDARLDAVADRAEKANDAVCDAAAHATYADLEAVADDMVVKEDQYFRDAVKNAIPKALAGMLAKAEFLADLEKYLLEKTNFIKHAKKEASTPLFSLAHKHIGRAESALRQLEQKADRIVPKTDPSRQRD